MKQQDLNGRGMAGEGKGGGKIKLKTDLIVRGSSTGRARRDSKIRIGAKGKKDKENSIKETDNRSSRGNNSGGESARGGKVRRKVNFKRSARGQDTAKKKREKKVSNRQLDKQKI